MRELLAVAQVRPVGSEVILFREGSPARAVHVLASGFVRIAQTTASGARVILRYVKPGEAFGTPALLAGGAYPADAVTVAPCTEMQWPAQTVRDLLVQQPCAALNAIRECEGCLRDMERRIRELSNEPVEQRIAHALVRLTRSLGRRVRQSGRGAIPPFAAGHRGYDRNDLAHRAVGHSPRGSSRGSSSVEDGVWRWPTSPGWRRSRRRRAGARRPRDAPTGGVRRHADRRAADSPKCIALDRARQGRSRPRAGRLGGPRAPFFDPIKRLARSEPCARPTRS